MKPSLDYLHELAPHDEGFRNRLLNVLVTEFPGEFESYSNAVEKQEWKAAVTYLHKLKHKIGILGMPELHALAELHEVDLENGSLPLHKQVMAGLQIIDQFLKAQ